VVALAGWAIARQEKSLITHVAARLPGSESVVVVPVTSAVMISPFLENKSEIEARQCIFNSAPVIIQDYLKIPGTDLKFWRELFFTLKTLGPLRLSEVVTQTIPVLPDYNAAKHAASNWLGVRYEDMQDIHTTMACGWKLWDVKLPVTITNTMKEHLAPWLEADVDALDNAKNYIFVEGYNRRSFYAFGKTGTADWVNRLANVSWIKNKNGEWTIPKMVAKLEASQFISQRLLSVLIKQGVTFGD